MTDYNDGKWHGWNRGECPVHPETIVDVAHSINGLCAGEAAEQWFWDGEKCCIVAFRVVKAYREPREFWIECAPMGRRWVHDTVPSVMQSDHTLIHVREVRDDA